MKFCDILNGEVGCLHFEVAQYIFFIDVIYEKEEAHFLKCGPILEHNRQVFVIQMLEGGLKPTLSSASEGSCGVKNFFTICEEITLMIVKYVSTTGQKRINFG